MDLNFVTGKMFLPLTQYVSEFLPLPTYEVTSVVVTAVGVPVEIPILKEKGLVIRSH